MPSLGFIFLEETSAQKIDFLNVYHHPYYHPCIVFVLPLLIKRKKKRLFHRGSVIVDQANGSSRICLAVLALLTHGSSVPSGFRPCFGPQHLREEQGDSSQPLQVNIVQMSAFFCPSYAGTCLLQCVSKCLHLCLCESQCFLPAESNGDIGDCAEASL